MMYLHASSVRLFVFLALLLGVAVYAMAHEHHEHATGTPEPPSSMEASGSAHDVDSSHKHGETDVHHAGETPSGPVLPRWLVVAGRFHPLIVHLPIGLLSTASLLYLANLWFKSPAVGGFVRVGLLAGAVAAIAAAGLGWLDAAGADHGDAALVETHRWVGLSLAVVSAATATLSEAAARATSRARIWRFVLLIATVGLLVLVLLAGHTGGTLVYGVDYPFGL